MEIKNAYYIKLGQGNEWADKCINSGIIRIGWDYVNVQDINNGSWDIIKKDVNSYFEKDGKKNGKTQDFNALEYFIKATEDDVFITFFDEKMFWCTLDNTKMQKDGISKFRKTKNGWHSNPITDSNSLFHSNEISGRISKTQAFQATICKFKEEETKIIFRLIHGIPNPMVANIETKKREIINIITELIKELHWKDCEILADLIFQQGGWHRVSMTGGSMANMDMEYLDIINNYRFAVQVKSGANLDDFRKFENKFSNSDYKKSFFIVFHPDKSLINVTNTKDNIEILFGAKLSELIFDLGLLKWVMKKSF